MFAFIISFDRHKMVEIVQKRRLISYHIISN